MIPPFVPDMVSDFPAETSTNPPLPDPLVVALICPWSSCITSDALIVIFPALPAKPPCDEIDPVAAPLRDKNRSRTFMMMLPALPKAKLSAVRFAPFFIVKVSAFTVRLPPWPFVRLGSAILG